MYKKYTYINIILYYSKKYFIFPIIFRMGKIIIIISNVIDSIVKFKNLYKNYIFL